MKLFCVAVFSTSSVDNLRQKLLQAVTRDAVSDLYQRLELSFKKGQAQLCL